MSVEEINGKIWINAEASPVSMKTAASSPGVMLPSQGAAAVPAEPEIGRDSVQPELGRRYRTPRTGRLRALSLAARGLGEKQTWLA